ncbi:hypothetical protein LUZ60_000016 [Juncus effusus]|nr:hypothetical protein LUZ60_000016 [Juncus effusus]
MAPKLRKNMNFAIAITLLISLLGIARPCGATKGLTKHHVIGGDQGWDSSNNVASWSHNKIFRVGDTIWFTYAAPQEGIIELKTVSEFESCELINPIRMYTEGLNQLTLEEEGSRYFVSKNVQNCKNGLKLHVKVFNETQEVNRVISVADGYVTNHVAEGPSSSCAECYRGLSLSCFLFVFVYFLLFV